MATIGSIFLYSAATAPPNYLLCNGAAYSKDEYPELSDILAPIFGTNLPDLQKIFPVMVTTSPLNFTAGSANLNINAITGTIPHSHSSGLYMPAHQHSLTVPDGTGQFISGVSTDPNLYQGYPISFPNWGGPITATIEYANTSITATGNFESTGGNDEINIMNSYITLNYIIKVK
jgi:microcystin-dependent protein